MNFSRVLVNIWVILMLGYMLFNRSFAYIGILPFQIFISEIALIFFIIMRGGWLINTWMSWITKKNIFYFLGVLLIAFIGYGIFQFLRGLLVGYNYMVALKNLVFNIYPLYIFYGFWIGRRYPHLLRKIVYIFAWLNAIYGILYLVYLGQLKIYLPWGKEVPLFGQPTSSVFAILGLLSLGKNRYLDSFLIVLNFLVMLGVQVRGEWLAFITGILMWALFRFKFRLLVKSTILLTILIYLLFLIDFKMPAPISRGGELSIRGIIGRFLAVFDPGAAYALIGQHAYAFAGTIHGWRVPWWQNIWHHIHQDFSTIIFGFGYGYPLWSLLELIPEGEEVRTPHNVFFYALGYSGWLGVIIFFSFFIVMGIILHKTYKITNKNEVLLAYVLWLGWFMSALVGNFFETPIYAIPFYLLVGFGLSNVLQYSKKLP